MYHHPAVTLSGVPPPQGATASSSTTPVCHHWLCHCARVPPPQGATGYLQVTAVDADGGLGQGVAPDELEIEGPDAVVLSDGQRPQGPVEGTARPRDPALIHQELAVIQPDAGHLWGTGRGLWGWGRLGGVVMGLWGVCGGQLWGREGLTGAAVGLHSSVSPLCRPSRPQILPTCPHPLPHLGVSASPPAALAPLSPCPLSVPLSPLCPRVPTLCMKTRARSWQPLASS